MPTTPAPLLRFRAEFPILEETTYLVSHSLGAMPRGAREGLETFLGEWERRGVRAWNEGWWELPVRAGDSIAALLGAPPGSVAMQPNVTLASAVFLSACEFTPDRDTLVTTELDFPSLLYLYDGLKERGIRVVAVPSSDGDTIATERLLAAIDERTALVAFSHVLFRSAYIQDARAIVERAHAAGAQVLLDAYQSAGSVPLDLGELGVEGCVGGCLKWLCGGPGNAFLYVRPDVAARMLPRLTGWQAHEQPFEFAPPPIRRGEGAWRFLNGTPAIPAIRAAEAGLAIIARAGIEAIRARSLQLTGRIMARADREGWPVRTPRDPAARGGTVTIDVPNSYEVSRELIARDILVDYRPGGGVRVAPHFYNTEAEVDHALDVLGEVLSSEAWRAHAGIARKTVT